MPQKKDDEVFGQNTAHIPGLPDPEEENLKMNKNHVNKEYVMYLGSQGILISDLESINAKQYRNMIINTEESDMFHLREFTAPELAEFVIDEGLGADIEVEELSEEEIQELVDERSQGVDEEAVKEEIETEDEE